MALAARCSVAAAGWGAPDTIGPGQQGSRFNAAHCAAVCRSIRQWPCGGPARAPGPSPLSLCSGPQPSRPSSGPTAAAASSSCKASPMQGRAAVGPADASSETGALETVAQAVGFVGLHHVGLLCADLARSLDFYCGLLGLEVNDARPDEKLPYGGRWLWAGSGMIHLMELPNPDPVSGRPPHGGHDRHACFHIQDVQPLKAALDAAGVPYTASKSGRPAIFCRDPDGNALEFAQF